MSLLSGMVAALIVSLLLTIGWVFGHPRGSVLEAELRQSQEELLRTIPDPATRALVERDADRTSEKVVPLLLPRVGSRRVDPGVTTRVIATRALLASSVLPLGATLSVLATVWGLFQRRRLMSRHGFHSLTFSYLGKLLVVGAMGLYAFTGLAPLAPPVWTLYLWSIVGSGGLVLYFRNLPPRL